MENKRKSHTEKRELKKELDEATDTSHVKSKWTPDPKGYFTIRPFHSRKKVFVRYYDPEDNLRETFSGSDTSKIVHAITERKLISRLDHAAYLGKETEKAVIALKNGLDYVQGEDLRLKDKKHG